MRWNLLLIVALLCYMLLLFGSCQKDDPDSGMPRQPGNSQSQNADDMLGDE